MAALAQSRNLFSPGCCSSSNGSRKKLNDLKNLSSWSFVRATTKRGGAEREVWRSTGLVCRAEGNGDGRKEDNKNENEMENPFDLEKEMEKVLESEESKASRELEEPRKILPLFQGEHLEQAWTSWSSPDGSQCPLHMEFVNVKKR